MEGYKKKIKIRQQCNNQLVEILSNYLNAYPDMRFGQALVNLKILRIDDSDGNFKIMDPFNEESVDTLVRVRAYE